MLNMDRNVLDAFHKYYYFSDKQPVGHTYWLGYHIMKCPFDLWTMQEIIYELEPDYWIETGSYLGGSALYFASIMDMIGKGEVISIDIERKDFPRHPRITWLNMSSIEESTYNHVRRVIGVMKPNSRIIVNLDSEHTKEHVLKELNLWSNLVTKDSYLICEDTNIAGHPLEVWNSTPGGPGEAVEDFLKNHPEFAVDKSREKHHLTFNPGGYLKRCQ